MVDTVIIQSQTEAEDPKHVEAMVAKADAASKPPQDENQDNFDSSKTERPSWLPEKFSSPEDLAKAYNELQQKLGKPANTKTTESEPANTDTDQAKEALASRGLDFTEFSTEFAQQGQLSDESYEKLEKAGIPRNYVDQYVEGQKAQAALYESEVKSVVGGDQSFSEMVEWAKSNLSPQEIAAYNAAIDSGSRDQAKLAVAGVYQKFSAARPSEPNLLQGKTSGASVGEAYESVAQLTKDMASPEYKSDPAFRARVQAKLSRSSIL
jgi:hypothetical protein